MKYPLLSFEEKWSELDLGDIPCPSDVAYTDLLDRRAEMRDIVNGSTDGNSLAVNMEVFQGIERERAANFPAIYLRREKEVLRGIKLIRQRLNYEVAFNTEKESEYQRLEQAIEELKDYRKEKLPLSRFKQWCHEVRQKIDHTLST